MSIPKKKNLHKIGIRISESNRLNSAPIYGPLQEAESWGNQPASRQPARRDRCVRCLRSVAFFGEIPLFKGMDKGASLVTRSKTIRAKTTHKSHTVMTCSFFRNCHLVVCSHPRRRQRWQLETLAVAQFFYISLDGETLRPIFGSAEVFFRFNPGAPTSSARSCRHRAIGFHTPRNSKLTIRNWRKLNS